MHNEQLLKQIFRNASVLKSETKITLWEKWKRING
jgi:hypothetical protein